jgi:hypothetical protein
VACGFPGSHYIVLLELLFAYLSFSSGLSYALHSGIGLFLERAVWGYLESLSLISSLQTVTSGVFHPYFQTFRGSCLTLATNLLYVISLLSEPWLICLLLDPPLDFKL